LPFAKLPLRLGPNDAAAVIAASVTRGHRTSSVLVVRVIASRVIRALEKFC